MSKRSHSLSASTEPDDIPATQYGRCSTAATAQSSCCPAAPPQDPCCSATVIDAEAVLRARESGASPAVVADAVAIFSALADPTRLRIIEALAVGELCVCDLAELSSVSQSAVSHQLRLLRDRSLVAFRRDGNRAVYRLADEHVRSMLAQGLAHAAERGEAR